MNETAHLKHVRVDRPMIIKIDGRKSQGVMVMMDINEQELGRDSPSK